MKLVQPLKSKKSKASKLPYKTTPKGLIIYYVILWTLVISIAFSLSK